MKKILNIWIVNQFASIPSQSGTQRSYQYAKAIADLGHRVTLWRSSFSHGGRKETSNDDCFSSSVTDGNLSIMSLKTSPPYERNDHKRFLNMMSFAKNFIRTAGETESVPDVIVATYPSPFAAWAAQKIARKKKTKFVLEIGDLWPQVWIERGAFRRYHPFIVILSALEKYLYRNTRCFVSSLPYVNDYLNDKGIHGSRFAWIPNGIDPCEFQPTAGDEDLTDDVAAILGHMTKERQRGNMVAIYVGGIGVGNRVDRIVQSAQILKTRGLNGISFIIIGEGHSKKDLCEYVRKNRLDTVSILNSIPRRLVPRVLQAADVGVLCLIDNPIYRYGVNLHKVYDYMAAGIPIVFSGNVRNNLVEDYQAGVTVPPGEPEEIAKALLSLRSMTHQDRNTMGRRGHDGVRRDYDMRQLASKYVSFLTGQ